MKDGREGSKGFGGDGGSLPLAIFEGYGGAAEDSAAVVFDRKSGEPGGWERETRKKSQDVDGVGGNKIGYASTMKRPVSSIKADTPPPRSWIRRARRVD